MPDLIAVLVVAVPLLLVAAIGGSAMLGVRRDWNYRRNTTIPAGWVRTDAVVVDEIRHGPGRAGVVVRQPVVTFTVRGRGDQDPAGPRPAMAPGTEITFPSRVGGVATPGPGSLVQVWYDPERPTRARLDPVHLPPASGVSTGTLVLAVVAAVAVGAGAVITLMSFFDL
ncbi:DUF3592 domain-containing protein [Nakamurella leprariae]|uniref:DUF3592 domain-containing protein n=1 Tax=Nakamurella leprariae TaxID=2803911 RepID=A0A938YHS8_9ACTN|nr:DUF3592 domain-containing protein [Nakamurella leprariae]MBM9468050.1 DUF3592 domain-containing protein [Nakamurella leprariae]